VRQSVFGRDSSPDSVHRGEITMFLYTRRLPDWFRRGGAILSTLHTPATSSTHRNMGQASCRIHRSGGRAWLLIYLFSSLSAV